VSAAEALAQLARSGALREVDRAFARLLQRMDGTPEVALAGALAMRAVALGHGGFALDDTRALLDELDADAVLPDATAWAAALRDSALVAGDTDASAPLVFEHGLLALRRYARYEQRLADALRARCGAAAEAVDAAALARVFALGAVDDGVDASVDGAPGTSADLFAAIAPSPAALDRQALAAWMVLHQRLALVTGGPGTGKTTTVARMLALLAMRAPTAGLPSPRIALAAPTGRAAARLAEAVTAALARDVAAGRVAADVAARVPRQAQTLHRLLGWQRDGGFRHDAALPLPFDVLVVDEASMVDLPLMARLVDAVAADARLVLLGDPDQLPAVEAGDVLGALCAAAGDGEALPPALARAAGMALRAAVPEATDGAPLAGHRIHLTHGYRQANAAGIAALARVVRRGETANALEQLRTGSDGVHWLDPAPASLERRLEADVLPVYRALARAPDPQAALRLATRVRVLTALRHGPAGAQRWNAWFAQRLGGSDPWFPGRLLMITANSYRHGLFNGDIGVCWPGADDTPQVWFEQDGRLRAWSPGQLPQHDTAFATTVHKAQGSEFDDVWLLLPARDSRVLSRELVYTGITRARRTLSLAADADVLAAAIARRAGRWSGLGPRLHAPSVDGHCGP
jgi:exodeoxyribonuclease V alpha subunit